MFGTIRRHQSWLWWIIAIVTIGTFGILGPSACNDLSLNGLAGGGHLGTIGEHAITQDEYGMAEREVRLRYFLSNQQWPTDKDINLPRETYIRLYLISKEKQFGIEVSADAQAEYARRMLGNASLTAFETQVLKPQRLDLTDFERFIMHELGAQQLVSVAGLSGKLVTPGEAETMYREEHQELACTMILLNTSNYLSGVAVSNTAVRQFYTNRMSVYREPAKVQVNYVRFNVTNYWAETVKSLTNLDAEVAAEVKRAGTNLIGKAKTPEESKAFIRDALIRREAIRPARRDAGKFADELYAMQPKQLENLETLAKKNGLKVESTGLFDETEGPKDMDVLYNFSKIAFQLSPDEPFSGSVMERDGVYILGLKKQVPSMVPPFEAVEAKVKDDFRFAQASFLVQQAALQIHKSLTNGLANGKTFTKLAAELGLKTESIPPFSLSTQKLPESVEDQVPLNALRQAAFSTEVGNVSAPARAQSGAFLLYVEKKLPVDGAKMKTELPGFLAYMRQARQNDAFNQWFSVQTRQDPAFIARVQEASQEGQGRPIPNARRTK